MTDYSPIDFFSNIRIYDTNDPVLGGTSGQSNEPLKALADRTLYLFNRLGSFLGQSVITASGAITPNDIFKLLRVVTANNITLTLDPVATFKVGQLVKIKAKVTAALGKAVAVVPNGGETIEDGKITYSAALYLHDGEELCLMAANTHASGVGVPTFWELVQEGTTIPFDLIGSDKLSRTAPRNALVANGNNPETAGALLVRADFARLWEKLAPSAVPDATWLSDPVIYRQLPSEGNGTTTFRLPDMRSMVHKGLDLGRGLSLGRLTASEGGYEADALKAHTHTFLGVDTVSTAGGSSSNRRCGDFNKVTGSTGGAENLVKNAGFTPYIFY